MEQALDDPLTKWYKRKLSFLDFGSRYLINSPEAITEESYAGESAALPPWRLAGCFARPDRTKMQKTGDEWFASCFFAVPMAIQITIGTILYNYIWYFLCI